jgi:hypothetical protein
MKKVEFDDLILKNIPKIIIEKKKKKILFHYLEIKI